MKVNLFPHFRILLFILAMGFGGTDKVLADSSKTIEPGRQLEFAELYYDAGDFFRAITEFERFLFFFPDHPKADYARYKTGQAYFQNREYEKALETFNSMVKKDPESGLAFSAYFDLSDCYFMLKDDFNALSVLDQAAKRSKDPEYQDKARYRAGWLLVETRQWNEARLFFDRIRDNNRTRYRVTDLLAGLSEVKNIPQKNPSIAGALSVIPGGGYLYCERKKDALVAFLLNGGLIWAAAEAFHNESPALGTVIALVEARFYAGNIYGGISSAHKYNDRKTVDFIDTLRKSTRISLQGGIESPSVAILYEKSF